MKLRSLLHLSNSIYTINDVFDYQFDYLRAFSDIGLTFKVFFANFQNV